MRGSRSVKTTAKETVKKAAATAKKAAEPVVEVKEAVKPVVEETVKTVAEAAEKAVSKAEEVKSEVKKTAEKRTRKTAVKESVYLQYLGKEFNSADIVEAAKKASGEKDHFHHGLSEAGREQGLLCCKRRCDRKRRAVRYKKARSGENFPAPVFLPLFPARLTSGSRSCRSGCPCCSVRTSAVPVLRSSF